MNNTSNTTSRFRLTPHQSAVGLGFLVLRLVAGIALMLHGWPKIQNPLGWMGPEGTTPAFFQLLAAVAEFGGGLALIVGLLTRLASFGILCTMAVATSFHISRGDPFVGKDGSYEPALLFFSIAALFLLAGAGPFSLDALFFRSRTPSLRSEADASVRV